MALMLIGEHQPELVPPAVRPFVDHIANCIANYHRDYTGEAEFLIRVLIEMAPKVWQDVLLALDVDVAEESLANCLSHGARAPPGGCFGSRLRSAQRWRHWGNGTASEETFSQVINPIRGTVKVFFSAS